MRKVAAAVALIAALGLYVGLGCADSYSLGGTKLSGDSIEIDNLAVIAAGNAKLVCTYPAGAIKAGTMRLDSIQAESIRVDLVRGKGKELILKEASATGGAVIQARRADRETNPNGQPTTVIRSIYATARSAKLLQDRNTVLLTGNVVVKFTEPGKAEPLAAIDGQAVTYFLKENKIQIKGQPAELTVTSGEEEKK